MKREYLFLCLMLSGLATNTSAQLFSPAVRYPVGQNTYSIAAADFDLDGARIWQLPIRMLTTSQS
jgi:hypothetical protein